MLPRVDVHLGTLAYKLMCSHTPVLRSSYARMPTWLDPKLDRMRPRKRSSADMRRRVRALLEGATVFGFGGLRRNSATYGSCRLTKT